MRITIQGCKQALVLASVSLSVLFLSEYSCSAAEFRASIKPFALQCEYLEDPLGIDVTEPRLSWKLEAVDPQERGQHQASYRILVASSKAQLERNEGDLWDSGEVKSDQSIHLEYQGTGESGSWGFWAIL